MKKKLLSLLLAMAMLAALAGCGGGKTAADAMDEAGESSAAAEQTKEETEAVQETQEEEEPAAGENKEPAQLDTSERVDLVFYTLGDAPADKEKVQEKINEILLEKVNATVDFQFSTWVDWQQKYSLQLTTGGVDLIYTANWSEYGTLANSGAFLPLDDLLDTVSPDMRELIGESALNQCRVGGQLYTIPCNDLEFTCNGIIYREDLREKYDLPVPNTPENIEAYLLGIKENDPDQQLLDVNGQETMGTVFNFKYPWVTFTGVPYGLAINYDTPQEVNDYWFSDDFLEDMKLLKKWADLGFWSRSALSNTPQEAPLENGLSVMYFAGFNPAKATWVMKDVEEEHPDWKVEFIAFGETTGVIFPANMQTNGTAVSKDCKNPERAMKVLELLLTDKELNDLVMYGIEGEHYEVDENGIYQNLSDKYGYGSMSTPNLRNKDIMIPSEARLRQDKFSTKLEEIGAKTKFPNTDIFGGFTEDNTPYSTEYGAVSNVCDQYLKPLLVGTVDDVDAAVAQFRDKLKEAGIDACREGYKEQWIAYCEEYGYK